MVLPTTDGLARGSTSGSKNIFTDLSVRKRIKSSLRSVEHVLGQVFETLQGLEVRQREVAPGAARLTDQVRRPTH